MTVLPVVSLIGRVCVSGVDGARLKQAICQALDRGESVTLDFAGVKTLASAFLNVAVGSLYATYRREQVDERVLATGLSPANESVLRLVRRNATKFFAAQQAEQDALATAIDQDVAGQ